MKKIFILFFLLICITMGACDSSVDSVKPNRQTPLPIIISTNEAPAFSSTPTYSRPTLPPETEIPTQIPTLERPTPTISSNTLPPETEGPSPMPTSLPEPTPSIEEINRLNGLITESYKLLTESERTAFERLHEFGDTEFRYFDDENGYAFHYATSYGVFNGTSVWIIPNGFAEDYEITVCGYTFYYSSGCRIIAYKNGEECEIKVAYKNGWLTEEDIAALYEIHTLVVNIYTLAHPKGKL